jgi:hypothetical protein
MTERKSLQVEEKLKSTETVKNGESEASLFHKHGIPEGTISSWMKEEKRKN